MERREFLRNGLLLGAAGMMPNVELSANKLLTASLPLVNAALPAVQAAVPIPVSEVPEKTITFEFPTIEEARAVLEAVRATFEEAVKKEFQDTEIGEIREMEVLPTGKIRRRS
jgi:hypothetical protein